MMRETLKDWGTTIIVLVTAVSAIIGVPIWVQSVVAQEAADAAVEAVDERLDEKMAPTTRELISLKATAREQLNFDMTEACLEKRSTVRCQQEAQHRRATWVWQDCVLADGEESCATMKPEPLPEE